MLVNEDSHLLELKSNHFVGQIRVCELGKRQFEYVSFVNLLRALSNFWMYLSPWKISHGFIAIWGVE